jgi:hypothetical protein
MLLQHRASALTRLAGSLRCLRLADNVVNADDWGHICSLTNLTELHCVWLVQDESLALSPDAFAAISSLCQLRSLGLHMKVGDTVWRQCLWLG